MKNNLLFPYQYKKIGWFIFIPSAILGIITVLTEFEPAFLDFDLPHFLSSPIFSNKHHNNNLLNEIIGVFLIISSIIVAFSKEKVEDEFISKIRLDSLVWAVYVNYAILLIAFITVYDFHFYWIMVFNMFTIILFFILRFNWQIARLKKHLEDEK